MAAGWRPEVFVFVNRNGERQEGKARGMGRPRQNWKPPDSPTPGGSVRWALKTELSFCVLCFWVQRDEGCSRAGAGPRRLSLVGNPGQLGTLIHSNFYRHVRTWDPVSSIAFFFF